MSPTYDRLADGELEAYFDILKVCFPMGSVTFEQYADRALPDDVRVVRVGDRLAAGLLAIRCRQFFGGRAVPVAAINGVGVGQRDRGRGAGSLLMRELIRELAADGVALSCLYPATQPIYRGAGYEQAGTRVSYRVPITAMARRARELAVEPVGYDDRGELAPLHDRRCRERGPGNLERSDWFWRRLLDPQREPLLAFRVVEDGRTTGYAVLRQQFSQDGIHGGRLLVRDLCAITPGARDRLWSLIGDHASMLDTAELFADPAGGELLELREQPARIGWMLRWMVRLCDLPAALEARGYPPGVTGTLELAVEDDLVEANSGRWTLIVEGGRGRVEEGGAGRLRAHVRDLAPLYTGHLDPYVLASTGRLEADDSALAIAAGLFGGPAPWMIDMF